ncbi:hypothetical protein [Leptospira kmetyi]|uniref:Uncharacterized protein n=1 Tax=Leptospira kmetyi TaxID=408139 RepID=A0ABX4N4R7_9LEPT|nr:hypothetical protein [Leptospira kmetyi]PJZ28323.1 hypothetical protein CH378_18560 [Leptospira kmetyi]
MYFLRTFKNQNEQHVFSLQDIDKKSICNEVENSIEDLQVTVEFEDTEELFEFYSEEIKRKPICKKCWRVVNYQSVSLN